MWLLNKICISAREPWAVTWAWGTSWVLSDEQSKAWGRNWAAFPRQYVWAGMYLPWNPRDQPDEKNGASLVIVFNFLSGLLSPWLPATLFQCEEKGRNKLPLTSNSLTTKVGGWVGSKGGTKAPFTSGVQVHLKLLISLCHHSSQQDTAITQRTRSSLTRFWCWWGVASSSSLGLLRKFLVYHQNLGNPVKQRLGTAKVVVFFSSVPPMVNIEVLLSAVTCEVISVMMVSEEQKQTVYSCLD